MADPPIRSESLRDSDDRDGMPRWVKILGLIALVVVLLLVVLMFVGGGGHGPGRHTPGRHTP